MSREATSALIPKEDKGFILSCFILILNGETILWSTTNRALCGLNRSTLAIENEKRWVRISSRVRGLPEISRAGLFSTGYRGN